MSEDGITLSRHAHSSCSLRQTGERLHLHATHVLETCGIVAAHNAIQARADSTRKLAKRLELLPLSGKVQMSGCKLVALPEAAEKHWPSSLKPIWVEATHGQASLGERPATTGLPDAPSRSFTASPCSAIGCGPHARSMKLGRDSRGHGCTDQTRASSLITTRDLIRYSSSFGLGALAVDSRNKPGVMPRRNAPYRVFTAFRNSFAVDELLCAT